MQQCGGEANWKNLESAKVLKMRKMAKLTCLPNLVILVQLEQVSEYLHTFYLLLHTHIQPVKIEQVEPIRLSNYSY